MSKYVLLLSSGPAAAAPVTATGAAAAAPGTAQGAGSATATGSGSAAGAAGAGQGHGQVQITGAGDVAAPAASAAGTATARASGTAAAAAPPAAAEGAGDVAVTASATPEADPATAEGSGSLTADGQGGASAAPPTSAAAADAISTAQGSPEPIEGEAEAAGVVSPSSPPEPDPETGPPMPTTKFELAGDLRLTLGGKVAGARATLHLNTEDGAWVDPVDQAVYLAGDVIALTAAQTFSIELPSSTETGLQFEVRVEYSNDRTPATWRSGWFSMTEDATLDERAENSELRVTQSLGDQLTALVRGYDDHGDVSGALALDPANAWHVMDVTGPLDLSIDEAPNGSSLVASIRSGANDVTLIDADLEGEMPEDSGRLLVVRERDTWVVIASEGGAVTPGAVTATAPTMDDTANTYTIPAKTGVIYKVGGVAKEAGTYGVGNVTTIVLVTAEADTEAGYTLTGTDEWSFNFNFAIAWTLAAADTFVGVDGADISGRALSGGTYAWAVDAANNGPATIQTNYARYAPAESYLPAAAAYKLDPAPAAVTGLVGWAWEFDYVAVQNVSFTGSINFRFRYQSDLYGAQNGSVELNVDNTNGVRFTLGGAVNDDDTMKAALAQESGTTRPLSGRCRIEIHNRNIRVYFDGVLTYTSTLPGDLLTTQPWRWAIVNSGTNIMKVKNFEMETAA